MDEFIESVLKKDALVLDLNKFIETYGLFPAIASDNYMSNELARGQNILPVHPDSNLASFFEGQIPKVDEILPKEDLGLGFNFEYNPNSGLYLPSSLKEEESLGPRVNDLDDDYDDEKEEFSIFASEDDDLIEDAFKLDSKSGLYLPANMNIVSEGVNIHTRVEFEEERPLDITSFERDNSNVIPMSNYRLEERIVAPVSTPQISYGSSGYNLSRSSGLYEFISRANGNYLSARSLGNVRCADDYRTYEQKKVIGGRRGY